MPNESGEGEKDEQFKNPDHICRCVDFQYTQDCLEPLMRFKPINIQEADKHPIDYLYPYVQYLATLFDHKMTEFRVEGNKLYNSGRDLEYHLKRFHMNWRDFSAMQTSLARSMAHLSHFTKQYNHKCGKSVKHLETEFRAIQRRVEQYQGEISFFFQVQVGMANVKEMEVSNSIATSLRLVTVLAFLFIPANFVTSIFGMGLERFGSGNVPLHLFIIVFFAINVPTLTVLVLLQPWLSKKAMEWHEDSKTSSGAQSFKEKFKFLNFLGWRRKAPQKEKV